MTFLDSDNGAHDIQTRAAAIRLAVFDVDGVMTDGRLYLDAHGGEIKTMHVRDGLGLKRLQAAGIEIAVISGRPSEAVARRMAELGIERVHLACQDKAGALTGIRDALGLAPRDIAVMGDDLPDLALADSLTGGPGLLLAVADAVVELRRAADWISAAPGGAGAVREACELLIGARAAGRS